VSSTGPGSQYQAESAEIGRHARGYLVFGTLNIVENPEACGSGVRQCGAAASITAMYAITATYQRVGIRADTRTIE
jgi:hypothetical protein